MQPQAWFCLSETMEVRDLLLVTGTNDVCFAATLEALKYGNFTYFSPFFLPFLPPLSHYYSSFLPLF